MRIFYTLISLLLLVFAPMITQAQTKRALVIGIGKQKDPEWDKINGDNDVPYVKALLENAGYERIKTLVNEKATKRSIVLEFKRLARSCEPGDIVYIHFSGHGQPVLDMDNDENDMYDECWIPYDAYLEPCPDDYGEKHLIDDEIYVYLTNIHRKVGDKGKILVVVDACHSGGSTRDEAGSSGEIARGTSKQFKLQSNSKTYRRFDREENLPWMTLSACKSGEKNFEMRFPAVGKLTYALFRIIGGTEFNSNSELLKSLEYFFDDNTAARTQNPELSVGTNEFNIYDIFK